MASNRANPASLRKIGDWALVSLLGRFIRPYWQRLVIVFALLIGVTGLTLLPPYLIQRAVDGPIRNGDLSVNRCARLAETKLSWWFRYYLSGCIESGTFASILGSPSLMLGWIGSAEQANLLLFRPQIASRILSRS